MREGLGSDGFGQFRVISAGFGSFRFLVITVKNIKANVEKLFPVLV